jgi:hypothetical protein
MTAAKWTELLAQKKIPNGAFRAIVRGSHRLWYKSPKVWYWCHDIKAALLCGLQVELVQDGANNAMLYPNGECVRGDKVFGPYFKMLADVQARMLDKIRDPAKIKLYKGYMKEFKTTLFGFLASKLKRTVRYDTMEQYRQVKFDREKFEVLKEWPINQRKGIAMTYQPLAKAGQIFKFPWARFTIALVSYAHFEMTRTLLDPRINLADIYYINTDGFVSKKASYPHLKLSDKVGDWKVQTLGEKKAKKRKAEEELAEAQAAKKMKTKTI